MRRVRSTGTKPELQVRRMMRQLGFRFRLNCKHLPGRPDLVLGRRKQAVFVHGCYWHQHSCEASKRPATHRGYWSRKLDRNIERDKKNRRLLRQQGWRVITVWECELKKPERVKQRLSKFFEAAA